MSIEYIKTDKAPGAIGPYSQAVKGGGFLFTSGQIPLIPETGEMAGEDIETQTRQVLANLKAVLAADKLDFNHVIETTIYMTDLIDFRTVNTLYEEAMGSHKPARATVQVAGLPKNSKIEIKMTALYPV